MTEVNNGNSETHKSTLSMLGNLLFKHPIASPIVFAAIGSFISHLLEYKSGFFQSNESTEVTSISSFWFTITTFFSLGILISTVQTLRIWFNPQRYFRESFSVAILFALGWLMLAFLVSIPTRLLPWYVFTVFFQTLSGNEVSLPQPPITESLLLLSLFFLFFLVASQLHQQWKGLKSTQQHRREQRSESTDLFSEGWNEFIRIWMRQPPLERYLETDSNQLLTQLESVTDTLSKAWEEQACELLSLSSSSYTFEPVSGWHDRQGCWLGENINTSKLVFLYPAQSKLSEKELNNFVNYAHQTAAGKNKEVGELVVAFKDETALLNTDRSSSNIRFETENTLLNKLVNFTDYRNEIKKRVLIDCLSESDLTLSNVYVPSKFCYANYDQASIESVEEYLKKWLTEPSQRQIALLGAYGQGKSSTALMFTYKLLFETDQPPYRIPILIELRGMSPRNLTPLKLLGAWASQYSIFPKALMRLHMAGRLLLIFEGFDEMALIGNAEARLKHFKTLWQFCYPKAKLLITGRPNFFLDDKEMKKALGISEPIYDKPYCEAIRLTLFTVAQIRKSLREQEPLVREQISSLAQQNSRFLDLVSRPSLLHIVSILWKKECLSEKVERLNSAYIMELFVKSSYRRQGRKAGSGDFMALNSSERDYFMSGVAAYMAANNLSNQITGEQLHKVIDDLIKVIPDSISTISPITLGEETRPLRLRLQDPKEDIEHIKTDVRTCGLLVDDPAAPGTFKFGHKSFMEYLFAETIHEFLQKEETEKSRAIIKATNADIVDLLKLPVSIGFLSELIGASDEKTLTDRPDSNSNSLIKGQRAVATRLFRKITGYTLNSSPFGLLFVVEYAHRSFARNLTSSQEILLRIFSPLSFVSLLSAILFMVPFQFLSINIAPLSFFSTEFARAGWWLGITFVFFYFQSVFYTYMVFAGNRKYKQQLRLWNHLCKELKIDDQVLHSITNTSTIPWLRNRPFDFFLVQTEPDSNNQG